ncbi:hypothetical protein [Clostridium beijerinckii]|uniref:Uncharacterized protein n=1 Tax=Clostridium beijerinckii TaxID=1520 RepID=A0AAW3W6G1_CLOBE|nr:hypothetical protein [Clostridium beijerinckii]MBC2457155.1 hypothetical protein [Clostridium beijerinckii]MBC2474212.1 hypothetical protein [Clostridium beijerinckii]NOV58689.1 hypothetical protein [Clostridium beijerinckii]NOV71926.1 hypothetical protein [Clostridium beijerinckii]NOW32044.1 hypothetical protein [Clostridium beijerinckii]
MKKILCTLLTAVLFATGTVTAFADSSTVPVDLTVEAPIFSVTVPTSLPITLTSAGEVVVADNIAIVNNSAGPVKISAITTNGAGGWITDDYDTFAPQSSKINSKNFAMSLTLGSTTVHTKGGNLNDFGGSVVLAKGQSLPLVYDAKVPAQKEASSNAQIAEVVFTVGWDE